MTTPRSTSSQLNVTVTVDDPTLGTTFEDSAALSIAVTDANDPPAGTVTISGTPDVGQTLTAETASLADQDGLGTLTFQWLRDGAEIADANAN